MNRHEWDSASRETQLHYIYQKYDADPNLDQHAEILATVVSTSKRIEDILVDFGILKVGANKRGEYYYLA